MPQCIHLFWLLLRVCVGIFKENPLLRPLIVPRLRHLVLTQVGNNSTSSLVVSKHLFDKYLDSQNSRGAVNGQVENLFSTNWSHIPVSLSNNSIKRLLGLTKLRIKFLKLGLKYTQFSSVLIGSETDTCSWQLCLNLSCLNIYIICIYIYIKQIMEQIKNFVYPSRAQVNSKLV